jgi:type I restriction enzyme S subunit
MERYAKYKDSGIAWLGEIPEHWEILAWRRITQVLTDYTANGSFADLKKNVKYKNEPDFARLVRLTDLRKGLQDNSEGVWISEEAYKYLKKSSLFGGEFLIANVGAYSGLVFQMPHVDQAASLAPNMMMAKFNQGKVYNQFIFYAANSTYIQEPLKITALSSAQPKLNKDDFKSVLFILPSLEEQKTIAAFLDRKTAEIDELIAQKERLIALYEEEKTAIINEAVTKGINPDVKLKPTAIDWLGDIPEHWAIVPMTKYLESIVDYRGRTPNKIESGLFLVTAKNIKNGIIDYSLSEEYVDKLDAQSLLNRGIPKIGDVLFTTEAPLGEVANIDKEDIALAQRVIKFRGKNNMVDNYFLKYWLMCNSFQQDLYTYATGSTALGIKASKLPKLLLLLCPLEEQKAITAYIEKETARIDAKIAKTKRIIELQKEYRTALISEAVTGKIKIPDLTEPKP